MALEVSVVIPVYNAADTLDKCLSMLELSLEQPAECIVVDDGSTDNSAQVALRHKAKLLSTNGRCGPARARNIGAQAATSPILLFLDADVLVNPETIPKIVAEFAADPDLDSVMGSYDNKPSAPNFVSQYRNLMHCFVHQNSNPAASTFWAGCGAIRRDVFLEFGGFNEMYRTPAIEDIELGYRMSREGRKLALGADIQVKHLKRWSLRSMMKTDFFLRALPWADLTIRSGWMPNDLNLRISQRISVALVYLLILMAAYLAASRGVYFLLPLLVTFFILLSYYWLECSKRNHKLITSLMLGLMTSIALLSWMTRVRVIFAMVLLCWIALFTRHRYSVPFTRWHRRTGVAIGAYCLLTIGFVWIYLPNHRQGTVFLIMVLTLLALNSQFYLFLAGEKGRLFALAAIPFHLLYFLSSGLAFLIALMRSRLGFARFSGRRREADVANQPLKADVKAAGQ
jgi:glycosyltransferase involved in cell wall biosynthesis